MNLRHVLTEKQRYEIADNFRKINRLFMSGKLHLFSPDLEAKLEDLKYNAGDAWPACWIRAIHKLAGAPEVMSKAGLIHQTVPYWNPTGHHVGIYSLGIINPRTLEVYDKLAPGERVLVPWYMTKGGKLSAIKSVAPQLAALPEPAKEDHGYDLSPVSYTEWNTFYNVTLSTCCQKQILWDEKHTMCVCEKCQRKINA